MSEPRAYLNGKLTAASAATVAVSDAGFVQGVTVAEQLRTFGGRLFRLEEHLARLFRSLQMIGVELEESALELADMANQLVAFNHALLRPGSDLGLTIFATPGPYAAMVPTGGRPTVCLHTFELPFRFWADKYARGESLVTTEVEQVSPRSWPPSLKCRSRMHYYLADRQARLIQPGARALMLDEHGFVTEATTANIVLVQSQGLVLPPAEKVLPGISVAVLCELARQLELPLAERELTPLDVARSQEVLLTSTSPCVLPVVQFNGQAIGGGAPGSVFTKLIQAWSRLVGLDIVNQAASFST